MLREVIADFATWRSDRLMKLSQWWHDVAVWITHRDSWSAIRSRRWRDPDYFADVPPRPLPRMTLGGER